MPVPRTARDNQRHRTRKDLLAAAGRLLKQGLTPTMDDVAEAAMVSRATAYRYFASVEALLAEAPLDEAVPSPEELFADEPCNDPVARLDRAETMLHDVCYRNAPQLRRMLIATVERAISSGPDEQGIPLRQNRRIPLIEAALAPARRRLSDASYRRLCAALALIFGTESMIVFTDVLGVDEKTARQVKRWAIKALVNAALEDSSRQRSG